MTILEILVSVMILAVVILGLVNVFVVSRQYLKHMRSRMTAIELGKVFVDPLQNDVRQDTWNDADNNLSVGTRNGSMVSVDGFEYESRYIISNHPVTPTLRRVNLTVRWNETD